MAMIDLTPADWSVDDSQQAAVFEVDDSQQAAVFEDIDEMKSTEAVDFGGSPALAQVKAWLGLEKGGRKRKRPCADRFVSSLKKRKRTLSRALTQAADFSEIRFRNCCVLNAQPWSPRDRREEVQSQSVFSNYHEDSQESEPPSPKW